MTRKLGDKLREYREKNGLTLGDVAKRLGCSYQAVRKNGSLERPGPGPID